MSSDQTQPSHDTPRFRVVQSEHLSPAAGAWLAQRCEVREVNHTDAAFHGALADADALLVRTYTRVDSALLDHAPSLRVVGRAGAGLDNIDVAACRDRGVEVVYAPDANTQAVVEYVLRLLLTHVRPIHELTASVTREEWSDLREKTVGSRELADLTLGILGLGRVGSRLAKAATGLGMKVLYNDLLDFLPKDRGGASPVSAQVLFEHSDILSIHVDGREANRRLVSERFLRRMKPDAILVNTSRGFIVDSAALAKHLQANPQTIAMLDVHDPEPFDEHYPLLNLSNARLYPHLASRTEQAMENMSWVVRDVVAVLEGKQPQYPAPL